MKIKRTATFRRCYKFLKKKHYDMSKLRTAIDLIVAADSETLIRKYKDHALKGNMKGLRELHIEGDWLLVYQIVVNEYGKEELELLLISNGSHDHFFRNS